MKKAIQLEKCGHYDELLYQLRKNFSGKILGQNTASRMFYYVNSFLRELVRNEYIIDYSYIRIIQDDETGALYPKCIVYVDGQFPYSYDVLQMVEGFPWKIGERLPRCEYFGSVWYGDLEYGVDETEAEQHPEIYKPIYDYGISK